jgi:UDP-glucose 4-epimerase
MPDISGAKYVVVGGASLLGSHLGEQLLAAGASEVVLIDNLSLGSTAAIDFLLADPRCRFVRGDILRLNELFDSFAGAAGVFAVAGFLGAPMTANPWMGIDVNVRGLQNVLEACRIQGVRKVVFSSSVGIYGAIGEEPNSDDSPLRWQGMSPGLILYCTSKIMGEGLGRLYHQKYGIDFLALRYTAMYGERQHRRALATTLIVEAYDRIRAGEAPTIEGDGTQVQDYVYAGDAARANIMAMSAAASGEGMNVASGVDSSQNDVIRLLLKACNSNLAPEYRTDPARMAMPQQTRQGYSRARAADLLGWAPQVDLEQGITRLVGWLDRQG